VNGNLHRIERVELKKSVIVVGETYPHRIAIEDGSYLKGSMLVPEGDSHSPDQKRGRSGCREGDRPASHGSAEANSEAAASIPAPNAHLLQWALALTSR